MQKSERKKLEVYFLLWKLVPSREPDFSVRVRKLAERGTGAKCEGVRLQQRSGFLVK